MGNKRYWPWVLLLAFVAYIGLVRIPRYDFAVEKAEGDRAFVYRFDRMTGRIDRYVEDGTCVTFRQHCTFEELKN